MPTMRKIKIIDHDGLRAEIDKIYERTSQVNLAKWSLRIAICILNVAEVDYKLIDEIVEGFKVNKSWQLGNA